MRLKQMALALAGTLAAAFGAKADPTVTINSVRQNYPWNNQVEVNYTIGGTIEADSDWYADFTATYGSTTVKLTGTELGVGDDAVAVGTTQTAVWTAPAGISTDSATITITLTEVTKGGDDYMVVDLTTGEVTYEKLETQSASNAKYNTDVYKTTKMVFRKVPKGTYYVQDSASKAATMAKDFYIGVFPVTVGQYTLMQNKNASVTATSDNMKPQTPVGYSLLRYNNESTRTLPSAFGSGIVAASPIGTLNSTTKLAFDLPTEAMWEVAARAMSAGDSSHATWQWFFGSTDSDLGTYAWYEGNESDSDDVYGNTSGRRVVGTKLPNDWGLYDVYGNVWEWCLDGTGTDGWSQTPNPAFGDNRRSCGGNYESGSSGCRSGYRGPSTYDSSGGHIGFRLARIVQD